MSVCYIDVYVLLRCKSMSLDVAGVNFSPLQEKKVAYFDEVLHPQTFHGKYSPEKLILIDPGKNVTN